jgi:hypothetical protein
MMTYSRKHLLDNNKVGIYIIADKNEQFSLQNFDLLNGMRYTTKYAILLTYSKLLSNQGATMPFSAF